MLTLAGIFTIRPITIIFNMLDGQDFVNFIKIFLIYETINCISNKYVLQKLYCWCLTLITYDILAHTQQLHFYVGWTS